MLVFNSFVFDLSTVSNIYEDFFFQIIFLFIVFGIGGRDAGVIYSSESCVPKLNFSQMDHRHGYV